MTCNVGPPISQRLSGEVADLVSAEVEVNLAKKVFKSCFITIFLVFLFCYVWF